MKNLIKITTSKGTNGYRFELAILGVRVFALYFNPVVTRDFFKNKAGRYVSFAEGIEEMLKLGLTADEFDKIPKKRGYAQGYYFCIHFFNVNYEIHTTVLDAFQLIKHHALQIAIFRNMEIFRAMKFWEPVYYSYFSRDCDMCESYNAYEYKNYYQARNQQAESYEWAEGPMSYDEISKEEYQDLSGHYHTRDRVMEAYENGNGSSIYV
jgi:hypothetical protein